MGVGGNSFFDWAEMGRVQLSRLGAAFGNVFTEWGLRGKPNPVVGALVFSRPNAANWAYHQTPQRPKLGHE